MNKDAGTVSAVKEDDLEKDDLGQKEHWWPRFTIGEYFFMGLVVWVFTMLLSSPTPA